MNEQSVSIVWSSEYQELCDRSGKVRGRASLVHNLIKSYGLLENATLINPRMASTEELESFHSSDYIECIRAISEDGTEVDEATMDEYGLGYDCPVTPETYRYASLCVGASLAGAEALISGEARISINWGGGWHHARKDEAAGFCYFNDIVVSILKLRQKYDRVLYIDIDVHHGDGVEQAFWFSDHVLTLSFHHHSPGFFPGSGSRTETGQGRGKNYTINVPLGAGCRDEEYCKVFDSISKSCFTAFDPSCVVLQSGADCLAADPLGAFNLTEKAPRHCLRTVLEWGKPLLLLGGGGYNSCNAARLWCQLTADVLKHNISDDIPDVCPDFTKYGPDFGLSIDPLTGPSRNTMESLSKLVASVESDLIGLKV